MHDTCLFQTTMGLLWCTLCNFFKGTDCPKRSHGSYLTWQLFCHFILVCQHSSKDSIITTWCIISIIVGIKLFSVLQEKNNAIRKWHSIDSSIGQTNDCRIISRNQISKRKTFAVAKLQNQQPKTLGKVGTQHFLRFWNVVDESRSTGREEAAKVRHLSNSDP